MPVQFGTVHFHTHGDLIRLTGALDQAMTTSVVRGSLWTLPVKSDSLIVIIQIENSNIRTYLRTLFDLFYLNFILFTS